MAVGVLGLNGEAGVVAVSDGVGLGVEVDAEVAVGVGVAVLVGVSFGVVVAVLVGVGVLVGVFVCVLMGCAVTVNEVLKQSFLGPSQAKMKCVPGELFSGIVICIVQKPFAFGVNLPSEAPPFELSHKTSWGAGPNHRDPVSDAADPGRPAAGETDMEGAA